MEEFTRGSGSCNVNRNVSSSSVGFIHDRNSYGNHSPGITITSDTVQVEIKFRQRVDENREKFFAANAMEEAIVPEMKNNCEVGNDEEHMDEEYEYCGVGVNVGSVDCDDECANKRNEIRYEEYQVDESYESKDELMIETVEDETNYERTDPFIFCMPQFDSRSPMDKKIFTESQSDNTKTSAMSPTPLQMNTGQPELDELVKKILKCDLCPQVKLTNFNESFAHHQHHHGLKFCPVCFVLVNCHDEFVKEHLKSSHLINDDGDVHCPLCSITIHHLLCFDHIKKDHLRGYYEQYEAKPHVHHMNAPIISPPMFMRIPHSRLIKSHYHSNDAKNGSLKMPQGGSGKIEIREPLKHTVSLTNRFDALNNQDLILGNKKMRNKLADEQVEILDAFFEKNKLPSLVDKMDLARACNLPVQTVSAWFGNRRRLRIDWEKLSEDKQHRLLNSFETNSRPTHAEIDVLCADLGLNHTQVSAWFKTRLLNQQKLRKRLRPNSYLGAKRRVTEMLKAKLESSDSESSLSDAASMRKPNLSCLDSREEIPLLPLFEEGQVCNSLPLGVNEKLIKVQDWINHHVESNIEPPASPDAFLETNLESEERQFAEVSSVSARPASRSPSPPVLTRPCSPPFKLNGLCDREPANLTRSLSPVFPVLTQQTHESCPQPLKHKPGQQFSFDAKQILREHFRTTQYLTDKEKKSLSEKVGATRDRIASWFQVERTRLRSFLNGCKDLNSQLRSDLLAKHRSLENIDLKDVHDKFVNYFMRGNYFTNSQELKLIKKFAENMHPEPSQIPLIAKDVGASQMKVSQWFTNRFQRLRRGKLPGYDLKGGVLIRLGTDTTYSEIKSEPQEISFNNYERNLQNLVKKEARQAVPTLQWNRSKRSPGTPVVKEESSYELVNVKTEQSILCLNSIIDRGRRLIVRVPKLPISPGTIIKVTDSELDKFDRTFLVQPKTDSNVEIADEDPSVPKSPKSGSRKSLRNQCTPEKMSDNITPGTSSSAHSTKSSNPRHFSPHQKQILEDNYSKNKYPTNAEVKKLAEKLNLYELQVNRWFTYQRYLTKHKSESEEKVLSGLDTSKKANKRKFLGEKNRRLRKPRSQHTITNRCKGFNESQRGILWKSFGNCDHPDQESMCQLAEETGLTEIQVDQWFRQQRYKKRHLKGKFQIPSNTLDNQGNVDDASNRSGTSVDMKPSLQDIKHVSLMFNSTADTASNEADNYGGVRTRRSASAYQAKCTNMNPASLVKVEMKVDTDSESLRSSNRLSLSSALNEPVTLTQLPSPVFKSREHSEYRKTYSRGKSRENCKIPSESVENDSPSRKVSEEESIGRTPTYLNTKVELPRNLIQRFNTIRRMKLPSFQKKISKLSLKFDELVEIYVQCDEDSKKWIKEESKTLRDIIELHEKSSLVFTCDQEELLIERRLKILNELLKKKPADKMWCSTVNSFHLENVFRTWYFLGVYCFLTSLSLGGGIADFSSKLDVVKGPTTPATWLIPPVLEPKP